MENTILYFFENIEGKVKTFLTDPTITESFFIHFNMAIAEDKREDFLKSEIRKKLKELKLTNATLVVRIKHIAGHDYVRFPVENSKINFKKGKRSQHGVHGGKNEN